MDNAAEEISIRNGNAVRDNATCVLDWRLLWPRCSRLSRRSPFRPEQYR